MSILWQRHAANGEPHLADVETTLKTDNTGIQINTSCSADSETTSDSRHDTTILNVQLYFWFGANERKINHIQTFYHFLTIMENCEKMMGKSKHSN